MPHFIFSSTCAVYGEPVETRSARRTDRAHQCVRQTKLAVEHALPHVERACGIRSIRLRYFNAAGATRRRARRGSLAESMSSRARSTPHPAAADRDLREDYRRPTAPAARLHSRQ